MCGWYQGNVLGVSEDARVLLLFGLFLPGFFTLCCWIAGYWLDAIGRSMLGDKRLPSVRLILLVPGFGLLWSSLKFWLPAIVYLIVISVYASTLPLAIRNDTFQWLQLLAAPVLLAMYWGNIIGAARYAVHGDRMLACRRRENIRLALANFRSFISLTVFLIATAIGATVVLAASELLAEPLRDLDLMAKGALGTLYFFIVLLVWSIACSHLVARYARKIGIGDNLKDGERLG